VQGKQHLLAFDPRTHNIVWSVKYEAPGVPGWQKVAMASEVRLLTSEAEPLLSLFIVFGAMPAIVAFDENVTVTFSRFDEARALHVSDTNHTSVQFRFLNVYSKHTPNLIDFFAKLNPVLNWNVSEIVQDKCRIAVRKIHFHHAGDFDFLARRQFERLEILRLAAAGDARNQYG